LRTESKIQELQGTDGIVHTIDTTKIQHNYFLDLNDEANYSKVKRNAGAIAGNHLCGGLYSFKKANVRIKLANIEEYPEFDMKIGVLKFIENEVQSEGPVGQHSKESVIGTSTRSGMKGLQLDSNGTSSFAGRKLNADHAGSGKIIKEPSMLGDGINRNENNSSESFSVNSANESVRQLKERRSLINEKNTPRLIAVLKQTMLIIISLMLLFNVTDLVFKLNKIDLIQDMVFSIRNVNKRLAVTAAEAYQATKIELLANGLIPNTNNVEITIKTTMKNFLQSLKSSQWNCTNAMLTYEGHKSSEFKPKDSWYQFKLDNSHKVRIPMIMNSAVFELINGIEYLAGNPIADLQRIVVASTVNNLSQKYHYYIIQNAFEWLRINNANILWDEYDNYYTMRIRQNDLIGLS
jgi:hypothetical protein